MENSLLDGASGQNFVPRFTLFTETKQNFDHTSSTIHRANWAAATEATQRVVAIFFAPILSLHVRLFEKLSSLFQTMLCQNMKNDQLIFTRFVGTRLSVGYTL